MKDDTQNTEIEDIEIVRLNKRGKISVLSPHLKEIKELRAKRVSLMSIWKIINYKLKEEDTKKITYNGFYRFCKRHKIDKIGKIDNY